MGAWWPCAGAVVMREQFNKRWPNRDKASDGTVGDSAHAARLSDHNPRKTPPHKDGVFALDTDKGFGKPGDPDRFVRELLDYCLEEGPGSERIKYVVFKDQVASATYSDTLWVMRGSGYGHWEHIHVSFTLEGAKDYRPFPLPIFTKPLWDGVIPPIENIRNARNDGRATAATYRVAARLDDLGYYDGTPQMVGIQGYPVHAVQRFQLAMGGNGLGNYGQKTHKLLFDIN